MIEKGDELRVYWLDADNDSGWLDHDESDDNSEEYLKSTGQFVSLGPKFLTLSFCHNSEADQWLGKHRIPRGMIVKIEKVTQIEEIQIP